LPRCAPGINDFTADLEIEPIKNTTAPASKASTTPVTLLFFNRRQQDTRLVRLDETGSRHEPIVVKGASRWLARTYSGHTWLILDENGKTIGHIVTPEKPARVIIQ
jgi:hypothetical protein